MTKDRQWARAKIVRNEIGTTSPTKGLMKRNKNTYYFLQPILRSLDSFLPLEALPPLVPFEALPSVEQLPAPSYIRIRPWPRSSTPLYLSESHGALYCLGHDNIKVLRQACVEYLASSIKVAEKRIKMAVTLLCRNVSRNRLKSAHKRGLASNCLSKVEWCRFLVTWAALLVVRIGWSKSNRTLTRMILKFQSSFWPRKAVLDITNLKLKRPSKRRLFAACL